MPQCWINHYFNYITLIYSVDWFTATYCFEQRVPLYLTGPLHNNKKWNRWSPPLCSGPIGQSSEPASAYKYNGGIHKKFTDSSALSIWRSINWAVLKSSWLNQRDNPTLTPHPINFLINRLHIVSHGQSELQWTLHFNIHSSRNWPCYYSGAMDKNSP